ncbi:hypothetical protein LV469_01230 [Peptoniphilus sp. GNH]|nr:hypothetical protein LV469_01230 [Peptoniphilus sp. GNH]
MNTRESKIASYTREEKVSSKEFVRYFKRLSQKEQEKILYIIKGAALVTDKEIIN